MADKDIIDFNKSQFDIMVDMLVLSGMSKDDAIVKVTKDFEDEGMVLKNRGGMMNINRMTAPLGYALGGPAGKVGRPTLAPELYEGFEPIHRGYGEALANINNPEYIHKWNMTKPRQPGLDEKLMQDYEPPIPRWEKLRKLGKKGKDLFTGIFGAKGAEAGTFTDDLDTNIRKLEIEIKSLQIDEMLMGEDNSKAIQSKSNLLEYYRSLK